MFVDFGCGAEASNVVSIDLAISNEKG